ncbi:hypothetical protein AMTRI_Chr10g2120 [Amborella trichopoda]|uniref:Uncharacterized protein n=1 Tax=Amborella trichopoda TaxID=13333 RepID=U5DBU5_AMBTC|nr:ESCRT-related protein CHMP1B [Amborella trichopoda]ERN17883.1 hypothetical protein AMTR_s00047p00217460 [Amborella trichopoda]|eukprot:XP_006856416.1 ESCRT-related protein CHMP1B [Amborella trichopoda]
MGKGSQEKLMDQIFQLKLTSKSLVRQAKKCELDEKAEKVKIKKAIEKGNTDGARIHAQTVIRKRTEQLNYLRFASRLDAIASRLSSQNQLQGLQKPMAAIVKSLQGALSVGNMQKISLTMDMFEKVFTNMEVQASFVESSMAGTSSLSTPEGEVGSLMQQVAEDYGLEVAVGLPQVIGKCSVPLKGGSERVTEKVGSERVTEEELSKRLENLKARG